MQSGTLILSEAYSGELLCKRERAMTTKLGPSAYECQRLAAGAAARGHAEPILTRDVTHDPSERLRSMVPRALPRVFYTKSPTVLRDPYRAEHGKMSHC